MNVAAIESSGPEFRFSRSINRGIRATPDADAWVLLNDDAFMDAGWLDAMLEAARARPEVGVWGAVLRYPHGGIQFAGGRIPLTPLEFLAAGARRKAPFWALRRIRERGWKPYPYMFDHYRSARASHRLDFITGACFLITRACHDKIGGYDEDYKFGAEDIDYCMRALQAGFEIGMATRATGIHIDHASGNALAKENAESNALFVSRWPAEKIRALTRGRKGVYWP